MILDCPACGARYRLPDDTIPPEGKTVRCARCKHSWVELGQPLDGPLDSGTRDNGARDSEPPTYAAALDKLFAASPGAASAIAVSSAASSSSAHATSSVPPSAAAGTAEATAFAPPPEASARRRWLWLVPLLLLIALALGAAAVLTRAVALPPQLASQLDLPVVALPAVDLPTLTLPPLDLTRIPYAGPWLDRRLNPPALPPVMLTLQASADFHQLGNGSRMLALTGSVANPTDGEQAVPEIEALVLDASRRPVYRWRIPAPLVALPPRTSAPFDSSASGYPASGTTVTLRFIREP